MARAEDITWTGETFSIRDLAEKYQLPVFALIAKGSSGANAIENLATGKIARVHSVIRQRRILVENDKGQFLAFPEDFKVKFGVKEKTGKNKRKTLKDVTKRYLLPATVTSDKNTKWSTSGKNMKEMFDKSGKMVVIAAYTEKFIKVNIIVDGVVEKKMRIVPFYVDIRLRVGLGLVTQHPANWSNMREMYSRALSNVQLDANKGPPDVLVFSPDTIRQRMGHDIYDVLMTAKNRKQEYVGLRPMVGLEHVPSGYQRKKKLPNVTVVFHPDGELESGRIWAEGSDSVLSTPSTIKKISSPVEEEEVFFDARDRDISDIRFDTGHIVHSSATDSPRDPDGKKDDNTLRSQTSTEDIRLAPTVKIDSDVQDATSSSVATIEMQSDSSEHDHAARHEASNMTTETEVCQVNFNDEERETPKIEHFHDDMYKVETLNAVHLKSDEANDQPVSVQQTTPESSRMQPDEAQASPSAQRRATIIHLRETSSDPQDVMIRSTINLHESNRYDPAPVRKATSYTVIPGSNQPIAVPLGNSRSINIAPLPFQDQPHFAGSVQVDSTFPIVGEIVQDQVPVDNEPLMMASTNDHYVHTERVLSQGQPLISGTEDHILHIEIQGRDQQWTVNQNSPGDARSTSPEYMTRAVPANYSETTPTYQQNGPQSEADPPRHRYGHAEPRGEDRSQTKYQHHRANEQLPQRRYAHEQVPVDERMQPYVDEPSQSGQSMRYDPDHNLQRQSHRSQYDYVDGRAAPRRGNRYQNYENLIPSRDRGRELDPHYDDYDHLENAYTHDRGPRYNDNEDMISSTTSLSQMSQRGYDPEEYGRYDRVEPTRNPQTQHQYRQGDYHREENDHKRRNTNDRNPQKRPVDERGEHYSSQPRDRRKAPSRHGNDDRYYDERPTNGSSVTADSKRRQRNGQRRQYDSDANRDRHHVSEQNGRQRSRNDERTRGSKSRYSRDHRDSTSWQDSDSVISELSELATKGPLVEGVDLFDKFPETNTRSSSSYTSRNTKYSPSRMSYTDTSKIDSYHSGLSGFDKYSSILSGSKLSPTSRSTVPISSVDRDLNFRVSRATHGRDLLTRTIPVQDGDTHGGSTNYSNTRRHMYQRAQEPRYRSRSRYFSTESDRSGPSTTTYEYSPLFSNTGLSDTFDNTVKVEHQLDRFPDFKEPKEKVREIKINPSDSSDTSSESGSSGVREMYDLENLRHTSNLGHVDVDQKDVHVPQYGDVQVSTRADNQHAQTEKQTKANAESVNTEPAVFHDNGGDMYDTSISSIIASSKAEAMQELDRMIRDGQHEESRRIEVQRSSNRNSQEFSSSQRSSSHSMPRAEYPLHSDPQAVTRDYTGESTGSLNRNSLVREQGWVKYRASDNQTAPSSGIKAAVARANSIESRDAARNELNTVLKLRSNKVEDGAVVREDSDTNNNLVYNMQLANEDQARQRQGSQRYSTNTSRVTVTRNSELTSVENYTRTSEEARREGNHENSSAGQLASGPVSSLRQVYKTPPSSIRQKHHLSVADPEASRTRHRLEDMFTEQPRQQAAGGKFVMRFKEGNG